VRAGEGEGACHMTVKWRCVSAAELQELQTHEPCNMLCSAVQFAVARVGRYKTYTLGAAFIITWNLCTAVSCFRYQGAAYKAA
jgi:hypothetical protein